MEAWWWIYVLVNYSIIVSGNGLSPIWHQAITWTNADSLYIGPWGTNVNKMTIFIKENIFEIQSAKWWPFCFGFNTLMLIVIDV